MLHLNFKPVVAKINQTYKKITKSGDILIRVVFGLLSTLKCETIFKNQIPQIFP